MEIKNIDDLNNLESEIKETQKLLENKSEDLEKIRRFWFQKIILGVLAVLFFATTIWFYNKTKKTTIKSNYIQIHKDSINLYKNYYHTNTANISNDVIKLKDQKIIYQVQVGAFQNFGLASNELMNLKEFSSDNYNKLSVGNFITYYEANNLKTNLIKLGFKDAFIIAQSYGNDINITKALALSNENKYL